MSRVLCRMRYAKLDSRSAQQACLRFKSVLASANVAETKLPSVTLSAYPRKWIINQGNSSNPSDIPTLHNHETEEEPSLLLPIVVMKMGGSSLGNADAINRSAHIIYDSYAKGLNVVVIVSALYGVTNKLEQACRAKSLEAARALRTELRDYHLEQADVLLSDAMPNALPIVRARIDEILETYFDPGVEAIQRHGSILPEHFNVVSSLGERLAVPLFAAVVSSLGVPAEEVYTEKLILKQNLEPHSKVLMSESRELVRKTVLPLLKRGKTPIVSGFIAGTKAGQVTTLGRGGSDLTATFVASAIEANEVNLWKVESVDFPNGFMKAWQSMSAQHRWTGIRSADPKQVEGAQIVPSLSYNEATELAHFGKKVLHPQTMMPLVVRQIPLFVRNTSRPSHAGTMIGHVEAMQFWSQGDSDVQEVQCSSLVTVPLTKYISLHEKTDAVQSTVQSILAASKEAQIAEPVLLALVGPSLLSTSDIGERISHVLRNANNGASISHLALDNDLQLLLGSDHSFTVIIDAKDEKQAMQALHQSFVVPTLSRLARYHNGGNGNVTAANQAHHNQLNSLPTPPSTTFPLQHPSPANQQQQQQTIQQYA